MHPEASMYYQSRFQCQMRNMRWKYRPGCRRSFYEFNRQGVIMAAAIDSNPTNSSVMLYEDGLDYENCHNFSGSAERFYEDILTPGSMANEETWKKLPLSIGLPTPPSTPEKSSQRLRTKMLEPSIMSLSYNYNSQMQASPNSNLQVVPDTITGEDVQDIIPFLTDLGNRSMASPNFFADASCVQGHASIQPKLSPPPCKPVENLTHSPSSYTNDAVSVCGFSDGEYQQQTHLYNDGKEGSYPTASYRDHITDNRCSNMQSPVSNVRIAVIPECILSPISPTKSLKRPYTSISISTPSQRPHNVPSSSVVRKLDFMEEFTQTPVKLSRNNAAVAQNIGPIAQNGTGIVHNGNTIAHNVSNITHSNITHNGSQISHNGGNQQLAIRQNEQYLRQMAVTSLESYGQASEGETAGESELSRATHNVLERQRRNDLKMRFHMLRDNLPELMNNEKAPKIQILKKAYEVTQELKAQEQRLLADKELERQRKFILLRRLHTLRQGFFEY